MTEPFDGAKVAILVGDHVVSLLRDDIATISWPGFWDLPGGGREGAETPFQTVARETREETGLKLTRDRIVWRRRYRVGARSAWFFVAMWPCLRQDDLRLGDEGQALTLRPIADFLADPKTVPKHCDRLQDYFALHPEGRNRRPDCD